MAERLAKLAERLGRGRGARVQGKREHMRRELLWGANNLVHSGSGVPVVLTTQRAGTVLRRDGAGAPEENRGRPSVGDALWKIKKKIAGGLHKQIFFKGI